MTRERRHEKRHPCTGRVGIYLAKGEHGSPATAVLPGILIDLSLNGAGLSLPQILDKRVHLAYTAMESKELILHLILYHGKDHEIILPAKPAWFNRSLSEPLTPFRLGVEFTQGLRAEQLAHILQK